MKTAGYVTLWLLAGALCLPGCIRRTVSSPDFGSGEARHSQATSAWKIWQGAQLAGFLIQFDELGGGEQSLYSVRNAHNQDLGWIDAQGRAWRYRLHDEPEWIGTGSREMGAQSILELAGHVRLEAVEHQALLEELRQVAGQ